MQSCIDTVLDILSTLVYYHVYAVSLTDLSVGERKKLPISAIPEFKEIALIWGYFWLSSTHIPLLSKLFS